ncbi:MAG: PorV/PorQ family protein [Bacteroidetes bacterium]|nr:PorV/PorQ family protein [Bacteroidota bacterium]
MTRLTLFFFLVYSPVTLLAQETWQFLQLPINAKQAAVSGSTAIYSKESDAFIGNPSFIGNAKSNELILSYSSYLAGIKTGSSIFSTDIPYVGKTGFSVLYTNYGAFTKTDVLANKLGDFTANDLVIGASFAYDVTDSIPVGATVKWVSSYIESYSSYGMAVDIGSRYYLDDTGWLFTAVLKNAGKQFKGYRISESLPTVFNIGAFKTLKYIPLSFGIEAEGLNKFSDQKGSVVDYLIISAMMRANQSLTLFASSHLGHRNELKSTGGIDLSGINFGANLNLKSFSITYAYSNMGIIEGIHRIDFGINLGKYLSN